MRREYDYVGQRRAMGLKCKGRGIDECRREDVVGQYERRSQGEGTV